MPSKYIGLGCSVEVDPAGSTSYVTIDQVLSMTPPMRDRETVEAPTLDDTLVVPVLGIEKSSTFEFTIAWDPDDTDHTALYTLFGSKAEAQWKVTYTDATPATWVFKGKVINITTEGIEHNKVLTRKVIVQRTGAITVA